MAGNTVLARTFRFTQTSRRANNTAIVQIGGIHLARNDTVVTGNSVQGGLLRSVYPRVLTEWPVGYTNEAALNMFRLSGNQKWCFGWTGSMVSGDANRFTQWQRPTIVFRYEQALQCNGVYLRTAGDDATESYRQPTGWTLDAIVENWPGGPQWVRLIDMKAINPPLSNEYLYNATGGSVFHTSKPTFPAIPFKPVVINMPLRGHP